MSPGPKRAVSLTMSGPVCLTERKLGEDLRPLPGGRVGWGPLGGAAELREEVQECLG